MTALTRRCQFPGIGVAGAQLAPCIPAAEDGWLRSYSPGISDYSKYLGAMRIDALRPRRRRMCADECLMGIVRLDGTREGLSDADLNGFVKSFLVEDLASAYYGDAFAASRCFWPHSCCQSYPPIVRLEDQDNVKRPDRHR
jgi:hypothetical protein